MRVNEVGDYISANFYDRGALHTRIVERQCLYTVEPSARELAEWERLAAPPAPKNVREVPPPSPFRLALSLALRASFEAKSLRPNIRFSAISPAEKIKHLPDQMMKPLYDFFEQVSIVVVFSYQALETYCNATIQHCMDIRGQPTHHEAVVVKFDSSYPTARLSVRRAHHCILQSAPTRRVAAAPHKCVQKWGRTSQFSGIAPQRTFRYS